MKRIFLSGLSITLWICSANAQAPQGIGSDHFNRPYQDNGTYQPKEEFQPGSPEDLFLAEELEPGTPDELMLPDEFQPEEMQPGGPEQLFRPDGMQQDEPDQQFHYNGFQQEAQEAHFNGDTSQPEATWQRFNRGTEKKDRMNQGGPNKGGFAGKFNPQGPQRKMDRIARLHLTPDQLKQSKTINEAYHKQVADLQKKDQISLGEYKSQLAVLNKEQKAQLQSVLTEEQKERISRQKKEQEINAQVKRAANLERLKLTLELSDDQLATIKSNQAALQNKIKSLHENDALLPEQKKEQLNSLMEQQKDIVKSVLTPAQQSKADSLRKSFNFRDSRNNNRLDVK